MKPKVYLGFVDEFVEDRHKASLNYTTNKVGGKPNWIDDKQALTPLCKHCGLVLPLIVQIYGPLERSNYHRTLYLFGCINPNCWNKQESWVCLRSQVLDSTISQTVTEESKEKLNNFDWCDGAGVWEDEEVTRATYIDPTLVNEDDLSNGISHLSCNKEFSTEAICESLPTATAEIEDDDEMVTVDSLMAAHTDLAALIHHVTPMTQFTPESFEFTSSFISVIEEGQSETNGNICPGLNRNIPSLESNLEECNGEVSVGVDNKVSMETYEKTIPAHGDKMFHKFISTIQKHPGQILRYIRDGGEPLFFYPAEPLPQQCKHCSGDLVFELQLLPTLVSSLQLVGNANGQIEFGTIFVLACRNSCWGHEDVIRSEYVYVQKELL